MIAVSQNLHTHSTFCDGKNTVREMAESAYSLGMKSLGFSGHAYTPHDESWCMSREAVKKYHDEVLKVKAEYRGRLTVFLGLEQDYYSAPPLDDVEYLIGSVHYVKKDGEYIPVDETKGHIQDAVTRLYGGDIYAFLEDYYELVCNVHDRTNCDIVGHIDLVEKFNADDSLFDRTNPRYICAYERAVKKLVSQGCFFEINTGAISRGYTDFPYPRKEILRYICTCGGRITLSSDSHSSDTVNFKLDEMCGYARECGFYERYELAESGGFFAVSL